MSRVLITGISSHWGGRLAQELERDPDVEAIVGIDTADPRHELERTEFVRVDTQAPLVRRILAAAAIDTVIDTRLITDPLAAESAGPRGERRRDGGDPRGVRRSGFAGAQARVQVLGALLRIRG